MSDTDVQPKINIAIEALSMIDGTERTDVTLDVVVPLRSKTGADLGIARSTEKIVGLPLLAETEPEYDERPNGGKGHPFFSFPVSVKFGGDFYPLEISLPLSRSYADRIVHRTRPVVVKPHTIEESEVIRDKDGDMTAVRRAVYPCR